MAKAILMKGGSGGVTSSDVTASKAQVLQGYRTITSDSNDEVAEGEIENRGNIVDTVSFENAYWDLKFLARMEQGFYSQNEQWKPCVAIPYEVLAQTIGVDRSKMLDTLTIAGKQGQIKSINTKDNNYRINKSNSFGIDYWTDPSNPTFYIDLPNGNAYYLRDDGHPHTCIDASVLGNATADKVIAGSTFTSKNGVAVQGQIVDRGDGAAVSFAQGREDWASRMWVTFKNGWYHRGYHPEGHEAYTFVTYEQLKNLFGIDGSKMLQGYDIAGVQGTVPRWVCSSGDVLTAYNNAGFVWDDSYAGRGRGIIVGIKNGSCIQNANWVFLPSPNLYPQNVAKNVNINGVTGTRDYIDLINPTWLSDATLNLHVNTVEKEIHIPNKFPQYNGLFLKVIIWGSILDGYYKDSNGGACPCVLAVTNWDGGANFTVKVGAAMFYGTLERQGNGFNDFKLTYRGSTAFNLSLNFLITEGFSHQWAGSYAT